MDFLALLASCTTHRAMQPTVTHYDQGLGPNICIIAEVTSADVILQNHAATISRLGYSNHSDVYVLEKMRESAPHCCSQLR